MASYLLDAESLESLVFFSIGLVFALYLKAYGVESFREKCNALTNKNWTARFVGVVMVLIALLIAHIGAYWTYREALQRKHYIFLQIGPVCLASCLALTGATFVIFGSFARKLLPGSNLRKATAVQWMFTVLLMIVMLATAARYERFFELLGYRRV